MSQKNMNMKPQDIVVILKIITQQKMEWQQMSLANSLSMSQSEVSQSIGRSIFSGLLYSNGKGVMRSSLMDFIEHGIAYSFPQQPGPLTRGFATAHSAPPLSHSIQSEEMFVWPHARGNTRGQSILPLYKSVPEAALKDQELYELLALIDAIRVGKTREKKIAIQELKKRIL